jgi:exodeoxyribonuclease VIII
MLNIKQENKIFTNHELDVEKYHNMDGISRSGLLMLKKSPFHYYDKYIRQKTENEITEESEALIFGNAFHTFILEHDDFNKKYAIAPIVDRRTTRGKAEWNSFKELYSKHKILKQNDFDIMQKMARQINANNLAKELISDCKFEHSIFWTDPETKVYCKARPDIWHLSMIVDLKTTRDASPAAFRRQIADYGYHIQAAMIQDAILNITGILIKDFIYLAIEKEPPFALGIYQLDDKSIEYGKDEYKKLLFKYKECLYSNVWPSYPIKVLGLPNYYLNQGVFNE